MVGCVEYVDLFDGLYDLCCFCECVVGVGVELVLVVLGIE